MLNNIYSMHPKLIIYNKGDKDINNISITYDEIENNEIIISKLKPKRQVVKILITDNIKGRGNLILTCCGEKSIIYNNLTCNSNITITAILELNDNKLKIETNVEDMKVKPAQLGNLIGKFYTIIITILLIISAIAFLIQKLS